MHVDALLAPDGAAAVTAAVSGAERMTSGEIVPVVVAHSDAYADLRLAAAGLVALGLGGAALGLAPEISLWIVPAQLCAVGALYWLFGRRPLLRHLLPNALAAERVHRAASLAFHDAALVETRDRTGILIYVSLLERRVQVMADRGIHARVADGTWDGVVERVLAGIRAGRAEQGLIDGIRLCGEILGASFPPRPGDRNELPDRPRGG
ncbi:MAG: TPM domain-containing protein [Myxococcota bacterium]